jgi:hypothetical protein
MVTMVAGRRVKGKDKRKKYQGLKQVIPTNEVRRELVVLDSYQRFGIRVIPMHKTGINRREETVKIHNLFPISYDTIPSYIYFSAGFTENLSVPAARFFTSGYKDRHWHISGK